MSQLRKYKSGSMQGCIEIFGSANEVVTLAEQRNVTDNRFHDYRNGYKVDPDFCGVKSYDEALEFLRVGYQPTVEKMKDSLKANFSGQGKRITFENDVVGFQPVVPLALQGVPNCMVNTRMKPIKTKVINICYDSTASWSTDSDDLIKAGQKMLAALIELEMQGYRFNLYAMQSYTSSGSADILCVKVKSANAPLDLKRISFPLTHTGFFRVIGFDWYSRCPLAKYRPGYGHAMKYEIHDTKKVSELLSDIMGQKVVYFSATGILHEDKDELKKVIVDAKV